MAVFFEAGDLASFHIIGGFVNEVENIVGRDVLLCDLVKIHFCLLVLRRENTFQKPQMGILDQDLFGEQSL